MRTAELASKRLSRLDRHGRLLLFAIFLGLLAGRFTLSRLSESLPSTDLRLVGLAAVGLAWGLWSSVAKDLRPRTSVGLYSTWFIAFCFWMSLAAGWSSSTRVMDTLIDVLLLAGLIILALDVAARVPSLASGAIWWWLYTSGLVYLLSAFVEGPDGQGRYSALGGGPNVFVRVLIMAAVASIALALTRRALWVLWALPFFGAGMVLSGSRGGLLTLAMVILFGAFPVLRRCSARLQARLAAVITVALTAAAAFGGGAIANIWHDRFIVQTFSERYDSSRTSILDQGLLLFNESPIIGAGLDGFHAANPRWEYAHNLFLASAVEGGMIGLGLILGALAAVAIQLWRLRPLKEATLCYLLAGFAILVASQASGDFYDSRFMWLFFGLALVEARRGVRSSSPERPKQSRALLVRDQSSQLQGEAG